MSGQASRSWPGWEHDEALAERFAHILIRRLSGAVSTQRLIAAWDRASSIPQRSTAGDAESFLMVHAGSALQAVFTQTLYQLWRESWVLGASSALTLTGGARPAARRRRNGPVPSRLVPAPLPQDPFQEGRRLLLRAGIDEHLAGKIAGEMAAWMSAYGPAWIRTILSTLIGQLAGVLEEMRDGRQLSRRQAAARLREILRDEARATRITRTETAREIMLAAKQVYEHSGVEFTRWVTAHDGTVCIACLKNQAAGEVRLGSIFPSGALFPPEHPHCRCVLIPADLPGADAAGLPVSGGHWYDAWAGKAASGERSMGSVTVLAAGSFAYLIKKDKKYKPWKDDSIPPAERIMKQLESDYPPEAIEWVKKEARWVEPQEILADDVDFSAEDSWRASSEPDEVAGKEEKIREKAGKGKHGKPIVMIKGPANPKAIVIDGHHRALAYRNLGIPLYGYVGKVEKRKGPWLNTHRMQILDKATAGDWLITKKESSAEVLRQYWRGEGHPGPTNFALEERIRWGDPGDWYRCVDQLTPYVGADGAKGYCNLRHREVTGMSTAQHAREDRGT